MLTMIKKRRPASPPSGMSKSLDGLKAATFGSTRVGLRLMQSAGQGEKEMAISLSVLSVACFIGAAISFLRYDSKYFDLLVLSGVIFIGTAMPSFEVDASLEELKSINHNLVSLQTAIEDLHRK
jgi:hypothetical protein